MSTFIQLLLGLVITTLTFLVAMAGVQVFHILHELKLSLRKLNHILNHTQTLSESAAKPVTAVNNFFSEVKDLVQDTQEDLIAQTPDRVISPTTEHRKLNTEHPVRRFFRRSGLPLRAS